VLEPFQRDFILAVYDNPHGTDTAILSMGRKNAKTALIAFLVLVHVVGPEAQLNSRMISGAMSREQAAEVYNLASKCVLLSPELSAVIRIVPSSKKLIGLPRNVEYQAISAEAKTAHGKSPIVAILDEVGQIEGPQNDFVDSITTAQGAHKSPLLFYISTQAARDGDLLSIAIDDATKNKPPKTVCHVYAADKDCAVTDEAQWAKANPALGKFRSLDDVRKQAEKANRMPSFESTFRNLILNQRVETVTPFVSQTIWKENGEPQQGEKARAKVYGGLDLSSTSDLTALVLIAKEGDAWDVWSEFWLPAEGLREKAKQDRVPYDVWNDQGHLLTTPGRSIEYEYIASYLRGVFDACDVQAIAFDRYNMKFLKPWLEKEGFDEDELAKFVEFGQGFVSMSPAIRELEALLLAKKIRHANHPVLTMCANNARVDTDPAGNRKFNKGKATGRIDGMVALAMAVGVGPLVAPETGDYMEAITREINLEL
jgi:phage terminase large subunit-like protein